MGKEHKRASITITSDPSFNVNVGGNVTYGWYKKGDNGNYSLYSTSNKTFTEGTYKCRQYITVNSTNLQSYYLAPKDDIKVTVDGQTWSVIDYTDTEDYAYIYIESGEFTVKPVQQRIITFDANGGSVDPAMVITNSEGKISEFPTAKYDGHYLIGWLDSKGNTVDENTIFAENETLTAKWGILVTISRLNFTFDKPVVGAAITDVTELSTPSKSVFNSIYARWYTLQDGDYVEAEGNFVKGETYYLIPYIEFKNGYTYSSEFTIGYNSEDGDTDYVLDDVNIKLYSVEVTKEYIDEVDITIPAKYLAITTADTHRNVYNNLEYNTNASFRGEEVACRGGLGHHVSNTWWFGTDDNTNISMDEEYCAFATLYAYDSSNYALDYDNCENIKVSLNGVPREDAFIAGYVKERNYVTIGIPLTVSEYVGVWGDADESKVLTATDAAMILSRTLNSAYNGISENALYYCDVDGNGSITSNDAALVLQKVLVGSTVFPVEA